MNWESDYLTVLNSILHEGNERPGRNGVTRSLPFQDITIDMTEGFPLLTRRKMYTKGILGEWAALVRSPRHVDDFTRWGCNYWKDWADADGNLELDYGNALFNYNGVNQIADIERKLKVDPFDRRLIATQWRPDRLDQLSLPCCWHTIQFYSDGENLDMSWHQRSADWCVGVPSDVVLAGLILSIMSQRTSHKPRMIKMYFGDAHVYSEHFNNAEELVVRPQGTIPSYTLANQSSWHSFVPEDLQLEGYEHSGALSFVLKE